MSWCLLSFCLLSTVIVFAEETKPKEHSGAYSIHPTEWIKGPDGLLYQFHIGPQSWILAREYCKAKNSDLVTIRGKEQLDWLLSHYSPFHIANDRRIQIGLSQNKEGQWTWVDGKEYKKDVVQFESETDGKCAQLRIHDEQLDTVDCNGENEQTRFVCERTQKKHVEQQRSENYIWTKLEALFSYFGIGGQQKTDAEKKKEEVDYFDMVEQGDPSKLLGRSGPTNKKPEKEIEIHEIGIIQLEKEYEKEKSENSTEEMTSEEKFKLATETVNKTNEEEEDDSVDATLDLLSQVPSILVEKQRRAENNNETVKLSKKEKAEKSLEKESTSLKELKEPEGSGVQAEKSEIEKESILIEDPEKLEKLISTMEKMIENMEKIEVVTPKKEGGAKVSGVKTNVISEDIEDDFDEEKNKNMPVSDVVPPPQEKEEDCDENDVEGSGENEAKQDKDLYQMPKISMEREKDVKEFLVTLKKFLARAEHDDLRRLLDDQSGRSLLERMKLAVKDANEREFRRMEYMMSIGKFKQFDAEHGMSENEQNEMFKKISDVVLKAAKKEGILVTATEPSARTTASDRGLDKKTETTQERKEDIKITVIDMTEKKEEQLKDVGERTTTEEVSTTVDTSTAVKELETTTTETEAPTILITTEETKVETSTVAEKLVETTTEEETTTEATTEASTTTAEPTTTTVATTEASTTTPEPTTTTEPVKLPAKKREKEANIHKKVKQQKKKEIPEDEDLDYDSTPAPKKRTTVRSLRRTTRKSALNLAGSLNPLGLPTFAPLPTFGTLPTPSPPAKLPTLEEVLEKLGSQFKMLLQPPKQLPPFKKP